MKRNITRMIMVVIILALGITGCTSEKVNKDNVKEDKVLIASGHPEYPPFMWKEGDKIVGVGPDLLELALNEMGVAVSFDYKGTWEEVQKKTNEGEIDMIVALYETEERKEYLLYTIPYGTDPVVAFVKQGNDFEYSEWSDFNDKKGVTTVGESFGTEFDTYMEDELQMIKYDTVDECFKAIENGDADYFVYALYSGQMEAKQLGYANIDYLKEYVTTEDWCMAISKKSPFADRIEDINTEIKKLMDQGKVDELTGENANKFAAKLQEDIVRSFTNAINNGKSDDAQKLIAPEAIYIEKLEDGTEYKTNKSDEIKDVIENLINYGANFTISRITSQDDGTLLVEGVIKDFVTELKGFKEGIRYTEKVTIENGKISSLEYEENSDDGALLNKSIEGAVGLRIELEEGKVMVKECIEGYPSAEAGLKLGDIIEAVDGMKSIEMKRGIDEAIYRIRGAIGTKVNLTINRNGEVFDVEIERQ